VSHQAAELHPASAVVGTIHNLDDNIQVVDKSSTPSLLPILRSQQQGELLFRLLGRPDDQYTLSDLARLSGVPYASVHREIERAEAAGIVKTKRVGRARVVSADTASPYYAGLADVLTKAFGSRTVLADALVSIAGIERAFIFGSWAKAYSGEVPERPVGDIDVLVLGAPDRGELYAALAGLELRLGREVQAVIRNSRWLEAGTGAFHANVAGGALVELSRP